MRTETNDGEPVKEEFLESLANGLKVLNIFANGVYALTIQETSERLEVTRAAARRIVLTLEKLGYLKQTGRQFSLTPKVLDLGYAYFSSLSLHDLIRPVMQEVTATIGETCSLGVLDGLDIVFVAREETPKLLKLDLTVGSRLPAYAHSMGQALLAWLDKEGLDRYFQQAVLKPLTTYTITSKSALKEQLKKTRVQGYSISISELVDGFAGVSVPLTTASGTVVAGLSVSMVLGSRTRDELEHKVLPVLLDAADRIRTLIPDRGGKPEPD